LFAEVLRQKQKQFSTQEKLTWTRCFKSADAALLGSCFPPREEARILLRLESHSAQQESQNACISHS